MSMGPEQYSPLAGNPPARPGHSRHPFRSAVLRGLGVVAPPLFTILIFVWLLSMTQRYMLRPITAAAREALVWATADIRHDLALSDAAKQTALAEGQVYRRLPDGNFVPLEVYELVRRNRGQETLPETAGGMYRRYVELRWLKPVVAVPFFLALLILALYLLGKSMAAGIGRLFWRSFEQIIHRLPLIRNVYASVKQVSDFLFSEREIQYSRVVAVEYPRKGIWSLGFVTGESMRDIQGVAGEPVLSVLMPTSPMPMTGFTITVRQSEAVELDISVDQALQFIVSCGVVVPPEQVWHLRSTHEALAMAGAAQPAESTSQRPPAAQPADAEP